MKLTIGMKIAGGFALALALMYIIGAMSYRSTTRLIDSYGRSAHTRETLNGIQQVMISLADTEVAQRAYLITGDEQYLEPYRAALARVDTDIRNVRRLVSGDPEQQRRLDATERLIQDRLARLRQGVDIRRSQGLDAAVQFVQQGTGMETMDQIRKVAEDMTSEGEELLSQRDSDAKATAQSVYSTITWGTIISLLLTILAGVAITRNITRPLRRICDAAECVAAGDLTPDLRTGGRSDEIGLLGQSFRVMVQNLRDQTQRIGEGVAVLGSSANQIVTATAQLAASAMEAAAAVGQTTATVGEVKQTVHLSAQKAKHVAESAQKASQISQAGKKATEDTIAGMNRIREQMESIAESVVRLSERSQAIGEITAAVDDIAEQSNLLAVNAAIEAAKAGEQGRGFAVVAQEIKSLAEQSKRGTAQVRAILSDIQKATSAAVMATEKGIKAVESGVRQSVQAGESIQSLAESIAEAAEAATQIAASSQQQLVGMDQVSLAMENIKQTSSQNAESTRQVEATARSLDELGRKLRQLIEGYRV